MKHTPERKNNTPRSDVGAPDQLDLLLGCLAGWLVGGCVGRWVASVCCCSVVFSHFRTSGVGRDGAFDELVHVSPR